MNRKYTQHGKHRQNGATLVTALVMLVVLTLMVISAIKSSTVNLRIAGNMQIQEEAIAAAQQTTEQMLSFNFTALPAAQNVTTTIGSTAYPVAVPTPVCKGSRPLLNSEPNLPQTCLSSGSLQNTGIIFSSGVASGGTSWCYAQQWEVQTNATDPNTGATTIMHQGVSLNVPAGTGC